MALLVMIISFVVLLILRFPIFIVIGLSSLLYILLNDIPSVLVAQRITTQLTSFSLLAIPFYLLLAAILNSGSATRRLISFVVSIVGFVRGGLGVANIGISMLFAGISGTAVADTAGLGKTLIPAMKKEGYPGPYAAAVTGASSTVGPIIPPSINIIIAGVTAGLSVYELFLAGVLPGILMGVAMMITAYVIAVRRKFPKSNRLELQKVWTTFKDCIWELIVIAFVLFGILSGLFTPTEAGAMGVFAALVLGFVIRRDVKFKDLYNSCIETAVFTGTVLVIVGFAATYGWIIANERIPQLVSESILMITVIPIIAILLVNLVLFMVGAVMETIAAIVIVLPTVLTLGEMLGVDPIQLTMIVVINLTLGLLTPPIGVVLFIVTSISKEKIGEVIKEVMPFFVANVLVLLLVVLFPKLTLWLPELLR
ncbi:C4-dicarboxylate ABC transporter permease [Virgibacillus indicus]|uniref:C4-dicarboxylate ABC transporter permease n=1 Tax=Virgibacillus indicus TaxID=2024554 RepID=A0A265N8A8_9BACI|nr:TRAP transporter large permease [Virgibacillus indicus]OZU88055.1 C4-dicarboxylate ABC transporter permease [Virgibacillus indicus]